MKLCSSKKFLAVMIVGIIVLGRTTFAALNLDAGFELVNLHNGLNTVDVDGDGKQDTIVVAHRENFNAHSFDVTTIYVWAGEASKELQIVTIQPKPTKAKEDNPEQLELISSGGADGFLHDYRLFVDTEHHAAVVITASRAFGKSFADAGKVVFEYFELKRNTEELPGAPILSFKFYKQVVSKKSYVDVEEAFETELGIGRDGRYTE